MRIKFVIYALLLLITRGFAQDNIPQADGNTFHFTVGNLYFAVDASKGGRVSSFKYDKIELLYNAPEADENGTLWGSVLWPSPQNGGDKGWGWPPSEIIDIDAYTANIVENKIVVKSKKDINKSGLQVCKYYWGNSADSSISIRYVMKNITNAPFRVAPWEVTRVPSNGIAFFPKGENEIWGDLGDNFELIGDHYWYEYNVSQKVNRKAFADGGPDGWSAFLNNDGLLFIKKFEDTPLSKLAPGEDEIEQWLSDLGYIELENQADYVSLAPGDSLIWNMKWYLQELPPGIDATVGNPELVNTVNAIIDKTTSSSYIDSDSNNNTSPDMYPNPNNGNYLNIHLQNEVINRIEIIDISGRRLHTELNINKQRAILNQMDLNPGVFIVRIETEKEIFEKRLIVQ